MQNYQQLETLITLEGRLTAVDNTVYEYGNAVYAQRAVGGGMEKEYRSRKCETLTELQNQLAWLYELGNSKRISFPKDSPDIHPRFIYFGEELGVWYGSTVYSADGTIEVVGSQAMSFKTAHPVFWPELINLYINAKEKVMNEEIANTEKPEVKIHSVWRHRNGNTYEVETIANQHSTRDKYPVTVVYFNRGNGTMWCRPLSDWHRSMTLVSYGDSEQ